MRIPFNTLILLSLTAAQSSPAAAIEGRWKNPSGTAIIAIAPCGAAYCGKVVWASAKGQREVVRNAPNVVGTTVLSGLKQAHGHWTGSLYIPDDNIRVSARLEPAGANQLRITGCAFMGLICRAQVWTRADGPLPQRG